MNAKNDSSMKDSMAGGFSTEGSQAAAAIVKGETSAVAGHAYAVSGKKDIANGFDYRMSAQKLPAMEAALVKRRLHTLGTLGPLFYDTPLHVVRGNGSHLFDDRGTDYLDCYNNVACVGHANPAVQQAVADQLGKQDTHSRYLQDEVLEYAERLLATFPTSLDRVTFTNSGSESNDLALRMAQAATGRQGVVVTRNAYHGITSLVASVSPSFGTGIPLSPFLATVRVDDVLGASGTTVNGGSWQSTESGMNGCLNGEDAWRVLEPRFQAAFDELKRKGYGVACVLLDEIMSSDGILPGGEGWVGRLAQSVHEAGGVLISDEVQSGFGRLGDCLWGFQRHGADADIVTMGKPMANGIPAGAVVYKQDIGDAFSSKTRYFNTFGGNPVSMRAAMAVLGQIERDGLVQHARDMGNRLARQIDASLRGFPKYGGSRHAGLFLGIDVASDGKPDGVAARSIVNALKDDEHVLISASGPDGNVLKVRPPLVFTPTDADRFVEAMTHLADHGFFG